MFESSNVKQTNKQKTLTLQYRLLPLTPIFRSSIKFIVGLWPEQGPKFAFSKTSSATPLALISKSLVYMLLRSEEKVKVCPLLNGAILCSLLFDKIEQECTLYVEYNLVSIFSTECCFVNYKNCD